MKCYVVRSSLLRSGSWNPEAIALDTTVVDADIERAKFSVKQAVGRLRAARARREVIIKRHVELVASGLVVPI